jgi:hypothetical protein
MSDVDLKQNGATAPEDASPDVDEFAFSPAVKRAWNGIEVGARKGHLEELRTSRQDSLIKAMSNVRTARTMLELKENELEDRSAQLSAVERQAREAGVVRARLDLENALQECDALAEELETIAEAIDDLAKAGEKPMIGGGRATRRRQLRGGR